VRRTDDLGATSLSVLLLADDHRTQATTIREHVDAFRKYSKHQFEVFNPRALTRSRALDFDDFDAVVIHYSLFAISDHYLPPTIRERLAQYGGPKLQYIQDDYRQVEQVSAMIERLGVNVLFTLVPEREIEAVWPTERLPGVRKITSLAGYVSEHALAFPSPPVADRNVDVGYRGRELPYWLGILGQEKAWIAQEFSRRAFDTNLRCDIGWRESDRIYGKSWYEWVASCRATLGTESGSTITDFDGSLQRAVEAYMQEHPKADFWEVHRAILEPHEGNVRMNVVSPRVFEAAALRTGLVLFPGEYSMVVEPDRHYIPLAKDFSNFEEVVGRLQDISALEQMVERTYEEIAQSDRYSFRAMVRQFDEVLEEMGWRRRRPDPSRAISRRYRLAQVERRIELVRNSARRDRVLPVNGGSAFERAARGLALIRLIAGDRGILHLAAASAVEGKKGPPLRTIARDLIRLAVLRRAQRGLLIGQPFVTETELVGDTLTLRTVRPRLGIEPLTADARDLLANGPIPAIVWDHSEVGRVFHYELTRSLWASGEVGSQGDPMRYHFRALTKLPPRSVSDALLLLLEPPEIDPLSLRVVPRGLSAVFHVIRHLGVYAPKAVVTTRLLVSDAPTRGLARIALFDHEVLEQFGVGGVLGDLAKLALLNRAREGKIAGIGSVTQERHGDALCFRTHPDDLTATNASPDDPTCSTAVTIGWDNSAVARTVAFSDRVNFALGRDGKHAFPVVNELIKRRRTTLSRLVSGA
jgi:hypothetical protein